MGKRQPVLPRQIIDNPKKVPLKSDHKISILRSPVSSDRILTSIDEGKSIFTDSRHSLSQKIFQAIFHQDIPVQLALYFKNKDIYALEFVQILSHFLKNQNYHPVLHDQILTASQEAYANAFLWSSLELDSSKEIRPIDFFKEIEDRLQEKKYADRYMGIYLAKYPNILEVVIHAEGKPIVWPHAPTEERFRGINLIRTLTDKVDFDANGKTIRLYFLN
ncbi:ATP-binding protein [Candidatus Odyssella acanthamoebae]|uniref:Uncharacterized protein n=1 Tax=Candidatus Odyssella acanthamoebae TaxID=91604 RepID=A0A077AXV0_9PROT|nr:ATP-binding protein [Candidatus Paracaedibacter acanthamoebae]AIK95560.1 hypothetical protein ID47_00460 [Candidatus Paracaedibacter acanthamoebae]